MAKSVRINLSVPEPLHSLYSEVAWRSGVSLPQVLVNALAAQASWSKRWLATFNYVPRDPRSFGLDDARALEVLEDGDLEESVRSVEKLSRQQRRKQEREQRKQLG